MSGRRGDPTRGEKTHFRGRERGGIVAVVKPFQPLVGRVVMTGMIVRGKNVPAPRRVVAAGLLVVGALTGCARDAADEAPQPVIPTWASDTTTSGPSSVAHLAIEPGTYRIPASAWSLTDYRVSFPEGWSVQYGHVFSKHSDQDNELGFYAVVVDEIFTDPCRGEPAPKAVGPRAGDLVTALLEQPGPSKSSPEVSTFAGYPATRIDLEVPPSLDLAKCRLAEDDVMGLQVWMSRPADKYFVLLPGQRASVYVVDVHGGRQVFLVAGLASMTAPDTTELQAALDSIRIEE